MRRQSWKISLLSTAALALGVVGSAGCFNPCADDGELIMCGAFGDKIFATDLRADEGVQWPAVATDRSSILVAAESGLIEVNRTGEVEISNTSLGQSSAPSIGQDGTTYVVVNGASVQAMDATGLEKWSEQVTGDAAVAPPAISANNLYVSVSTNDNHGRDLLTLDKATGAVVQKREGGSAPVVSEDGSVTYMEDPENCGAVYQALVAENPDGSEKWRHLDTSGFIDFAPGPDGEIYVVTGNRVLMRLSNRGEVEWTFEPECTDCTVAAAPTVTDDAVYFPVWQGVTNNPGCNAEDAEFLDPEDGVDPLFALSREGDVLWKYDGFSTLARRYDEGGGATGGLLLAAHIPTSFHHPSGRPVVAEDGTLFVPSDGAVVSLSPDGEELGYALYNPAAGEVREGTGGLMGNNTWINSGLSVPPILGPTGDLFVWDGFQLRGFETGKRSANIPWTAPFGGNTNSGQVGGR